MPFPFLPFGALLAIGVLGGALAAFGLALRLGNRAALTVRQSIAPGVVSGLRGWTGQAPRTRAASPASPSRAGEPASASIVELAVPAEDVPVHRVRRR